MICNNLNTSNVKGFDYFGARYYDSDISIWLSIDPLAHLYPNESPYCYAGWNPIMIVDPNGMYKDPTDADKAQKEATEKYGADRVSSVYNANAGTDKEADYRFNIYKEGEDKYVHKTEEGAEFGYVPDKIISSDDDVVDYNNVQQMKEVMKVFNKYGAGYVSDSKTNDIIPKQQKKSRNDEIIESLVEGPGVLVIGAVNTGAGVVAGGFVIIVNGETMKMQWMQENYQNNGNGMGLYVFNVNAPGALPRAAIFCASDGSFVGWHHTIVKGAPSIQYHQYLTLLRELR